MYDAHKIYYLSGASEKNTSNQKDLNDEKIYGNPDDFYHGPQSRTIKSGQTRNTQNKTYLKWIILGIFLFCIGFGAGFGSAIPSLRNIWKKGSPCLANQGSKIVNQPCIFPFTYQGLTYNDCTTDGDKIPWCATATDKNGHLILDQWGYCSNECQTNPHSEEIPSGFDGEK